MNGQGLPEKVTAAREWAEMLREGPDAWMLSNLVIGVDHVRALLAAYDAVVEERDAQASKFQRAAISAWTLLAGVRFGERNPKRSVLGQAMNAIRPFANLAADAQAKSGEPTP